MNKKEKEFFELYKKHYEVFFEKYFLSRDIIEAIYEAAKETILSLIRVYIKFLFLEDTLKIITTDKKTIKKLNPVKRKLLKETYEGIEYICKTIYQILEPITKGLQEDI